MNTAMRFEASDKNCQGVYMLRNGDYAKALAFFYEALSITDTGYVVEQEDSKEIGFLTDVDCTETPATNKYSQSSHCDNANVGSMRKETSISNQCEAEETNSFNGPNDYLTPCDCTSVTIPNLVHKDFALYNRAILFYPEESCCSPEEEKEEEEEEEDVADFPFYCAIIIFNMAICYHSMGQQFGVSRSLQQANRFYDTCYHVLKDELLPLCGGTHLLLAACLNNQAVICYDLIDRTYEGLLRDMARLLQSFPSLAKEAAASNSNETPPFLTNILLCPKTFYTAPSA